MKNAGGQVVNGPYEFPGGRRFHFTDPSGTELGGLGRGLARRAAPGLVPPNATSLQGQDVVVVR